MTQDATSTINSSTGFEELLSEGQRLLGTDAAAALKQAEAIIRRSPDARAFRLAAQACRRIGRMTEAEGAELSAIKAATANVELRAAALAESEGRSDDALGIARTYLVAQPDDLLAMIIEAEALLKLWDLEAAEARLRSILERAPSFLRASVMLAECLAKQARVREAVAVLDEVTSRKPGNLVALSASALNRTELGDIDMALSLHLRLSQIDGRRPSRWIHLAHDYRMLGRTQDAIGAFRQALEIDPTNGSAWWGMANYFPQALNERDSATIREALSKSAQSRNTGALHLAAGLVAHQAGEYEVAFSEIAAGKRLQVEHHPYDPASVSAAIDGVIRILTADFYSKRKSSGCPETAPIFLVGMHRSGSTLIERILGRHSSIEATGELQIIPRLSEWARHKVGNPEIHAEILEILSDDELAAIGHRYVAASADYRHTTRPFFIDKNNINWMQAGLILLALPNAKIIDVRRNAVDCCWANFKMLFAEGFPPANDLRHVGRFYRDYVRLFDAMKRAAPDRILPVRYEEVVDDLEGQTRKILDFLGLPFEPDCLEFHLSTGAIATASSEQVRQPLNRKGIGSAEPYRQWLGPLIEELGPLAESSTSA